MRKILLILVLFYCRQVLAQPYVNVLYWNNKNFGFGHVALEVFDEENATHPKFYLSYAMRNNYRLDKEKHGKEPQRIKIPFKSQHDYNEFKKWFVNSIYAKPFQRDYVRMYRFLHHNCVHAVAHAMEHLGHDFPRKLNTVRRPKSLQRLALRWHKKNRADENR